MNGEDEDNKKYYSTNKGGTLCNFRHFNTEHFVQCTLWVVDILRMYILSCTVSNLCWECDCFVKLTLLKQKYVNKLKTPFNTCFPGNR